MCIGLGAGYWVKTRIGNCEGILLALGFELLK